MIGYKGFDKDLKCRGKQYSENTIFEEDKAEICENGMHFCKNPFDVWGCYPPCDKHGNLNKFTTVEALDEPVTDDNKKYCTTKLKVGAVLGLGDFVKAGVDFILEKAKKNTKSNTGHRSASTNTGYCSASTNTGDYSASTNTGHRSASINTGDYSASTNTGNCSASTNTGHCSVSTNTGYCSVSTNTGYYSASTNTGNCSASTNTGDYSASTNTGDYSASTNTGYCSASINTGNYSASTNTGNCSASTNTGYRSASIVEGRDSVAITTGYQGKAKGKKGCWLACVERNNNHEILDFKTVKVDGKIIKNDTFYMLKNGKFEEAADE